MTTVPPPAPVVDPLPSLRVEATELKKPADRLGPAAKAAAERAAMRMAELDAKMVPGKVIVEKDELAQRFIATVVDVQTQEIERRYPNETQLAFSRAVNAYMRAKSES
jgi:hypothetical protein